MNVIHSSVSAHMPWCTFGTLATTMMLQGAVAASVFRNYPACLTGANLTMREGMIPHDSPMAAEAISRKFLPLQEVWLDLDPEVEDQDECSGALGMQDGRIKASQLEASSIYPTESCALDNIRLHRRSAWCAEDPEDFPKIWVQVDLGRPTWLTKIATQGRREHSQWVKSYGLVFSNDSRAWQQYPQLLMANTNNDEPRNNSFSPPIRTRYVRLYPKDWHNHPSMRIELYGAVECVCHEVAVEYRGFDLAIAPKLRQRKFASPRACQLACAAFGGCGAWTHDGSTGECRLKTLRARSEGRVTGQRPSLTSGPKNCKIEANPGEAYLWDDPLAAAPPAPAPSDAGALERPRRDEHADRHTAADAREALEPEGRRKHKALEPEGRREE